MEHGPTTAIAGADPRLYNPDLAPVPAERRTWNTYNFAALWIAMAHCIPTYMLASSLIQNGMNWWQALVTIALGNCIVLVPILLNAHPGTKYGIPFPAFARASFGVFGANVPALLRALVACGWFGIQTFIGGHAVHKLLTVLWPAWGTLGGGASFAGLPLPEWITFLSFWALNMAIVWKGMDAVRIFENWAAPLVLLMTAGLLAWAISAAHGLGPITAHPSAFHDFHAFWLVFIPSLNAMIAYWATLSLNVPDFTRYGKDQRAQAIGQALGLPPTMTVFAGMGVLITSATAVVFGTPIWDPVDLLARLGNPWIVALGVVGVIIATISVNIAANVVSPANDFSNLWPSKISFKRGGLITGLVGIAILPWKLLDPHVYIFDWLGGYSTFLGPIAGILIADYWVARKTELVPEELYRSVGRYTYRRGFNPAALIALGAGAGVALIGLVIPVLRPLFDYGWFIGFGVAFALYLLLRSPAHAPELAAPAS
ncbi:MAG TPA: NCS1 family nucleobase:cation symporter-1 [Myxococcales bacterium]|nr:NCS1 family nucleobase:cation symporter-1 [Myxococcales bacterium]